MGGVHPGGELRHILTSVTAADLARLPLSTLRAAAATVDRLLRTIVRASEEEMEAIERELVQAIQDEWTGRMPGALDAAIEELADSIDSGVFTESDLERVIAAIEAKMTAGLVASVTDNVGSAIGNAYGKGRAEVLQPLHLEIDFNLVDEHAQRVLQNDTLYWVGSAWDRKFGGEIAAAIREAVIEKGLGRKEAAEELERLFGSDFSDKSLSYWEIVASAGVVRARAFGSVESFVQAQVETYLVIEVGDARTCPTCEYMNGREFRVESAVRVRDSFLGAEDPEEAKAAHPWVAFKDVDGKTTAELDAAGLALPPYHGRCRGSVVASTFRA